MILGKICGAVWKILSKAETYEVNVKGVVNATGVYCGRYHANG